MSLTTGTEIKPRANTLGEIGATPLTNDQINHLKNFNRRNLIEHLGIDVGENWNNSIPFTGLTPRIYLMRTDANGEDKTRTLSNAGIAFGSPEFWREVQLGNVYAFPAGSSDPVQMQLSEDKEDIEFSKPITKENQPDPPAKPLSWWKTVLSWFGGYKAEKKAWQNRLQNKQNALKKLEEMQEDRAKHIGENGQLDKNAAADMLDQFDKKNDLEASEKNAQTAEDGMKLMTSIYQPQPEMMDKKGVLAKKNSPGLYTEKQFNDLKVYPKDGPDGIDLSKIQVGESGESVKPEEFAAVTMYALWQPDVAMDGLERQTALVSKLKAEKAHMDPYAEQSILSYENPMNPGEKLFKKEDVNALMTSSVRNWWTGDLFISKPREGEGAYFKGTTNMGRKLTVDAFKAYAGGDNTKLAKLIADGINMAAQEMTREEGNLNPQQEAVVVTSGKLLDLMQKDPKLKDAALAQGMKPENLTYAEGLKVLNRMCEEGREAERKLAEARVNGTELSQAEKVKLTTAMLKPKIALSQLGTENTAQNEAEDRMLIMGSIYNDSANIKVNGKKPNKFDYDKWLEHPEDRPPIKPGQMYFDTASIIYKNVGVIWNKNAESINKLAAPNGEKNLEKLVGSIIKQEGLENKSPDWLYKEFNHAQTQPTLKLADSIIKVSKNTYNVGQDEPKKEVQEPQKGKSIADRKAMFEKKPEGPKIS